MHLRFAVCILVLVTSVSSHLLNLASAQRGIKTQSTSPVLHVPSPQDILGFTPGDDRKLASWNQIIDYFEKLDRASERVRFETLGKTTMEKPFVLATISAPENLTRLEEYRRIQEQLADPRKLGSNPERKASELIARGKTIVLITCGIHSTEVGSTLSSTLIAHRLASSDEPEVLNILKNTIILLVPSLNPDGVDIVKNWYHKTLGTPYEGTEPPELYHKYVGHDNNRDWYAFTQVETQITVDKIHNVWHPQIVHDIHQQSAFGARLFLPPYMQPVEPNVPKQIVEGYIQLGNWMASEMRAQGFKGITTNSTYDAWTPARAYSHYHAGVRILSETASARLATPITLKFEELRSRGGFSPQKESDNFGPVWRGGEWHLRDITNYMTTAAFNLMTHAAVNRAKWLRRFYEISKEAVTTPQAGEPSGFVVSLYGDDLNSLSTLSEIDPQRKPGQMPERYDRLATGRLLGILLNAGLEIFRVGMVSSNKPAKAGDYFIPTSQPYGAFAKALLRRQKYPDLRDGDGHPITPYDVTAHTLPLLMGVDVTEYFGNPKQLHLQQVTRIRVSLSPCTSESPCVSSNLGLYKSHVPSMDEGWTRWILERHALSKKADVLTDREIRTANLQNTYQTIIIPDQLPSVILNGHRTGTMPDDYTGGLGAAGVKALRDFVQDGGNLVLLNRASDFAIEQLNLPLRNVVAGLPRRDFYVPGSILRIELDIAHPITKDMPKESIAWVENSPVFEVVQSEKSSVPASAVKVIARYPENQDPLLSGCLLGGERIKGKAALVEVTMGQGRIILFGFRPQYRGQSLATYPLLFNSISQ